MTVLNKVVRVAGKVNKRRGVTLTEKLPYDADTPIEVIIIPGILDESTVGSKNASTDIIRTKFES